MRWLRLQVAKCFATKWWHCFGHLIKVTHVAWLLRAGQDPTGAQVGQKPLREEVQHNKFPAYSCQGQGKASGPLASWEIWFCFGVWGTWKFTLVADSSHLWMNETTLYLQGILVLSVVHTDSLGRTRTGGKWVMLLNALNQALNLVLPSASLSIFTSLGSNSKALLSTMTT